jgi:hypothetical protein
MKDKEKYIIFLICAITMLFGFVSGKNVNCLTTSNLIGCITCDNTSFKVLDNDTKKYVCNDIQNCNLISN